jgi:hypothetical protein
MAAQFADRDAFENIVRTMLERGGQGSFGRIHLVSVLADSDEASLGATLPKALIIAEKIIQRRLTPEDACVPLDQGKFMLVFPGLTDAEGSIKATAISREIKERLFGQSAGHINVTVQVLPLDRLRQRPAAAALPAMESILDVHERHAAVNLQVAFQPLWDVTRQAIIGNRAMTRRQFQGHELLDDAVQLAGDQDPLARDRNSSLQHAVMAAALRRPGGLMIMPQALNDHTMLDLAHLTAEIRQLGAVCSDGLMVELTGAVGSAGHARLRDVIRAVMAGGATVGVRIFPEPEMARFLRECGVSHLCFNEAQAKQAAFTHSALYALLSVVAHEVKGTGLGLALWNTSSGQDIKRAAALGFTLFSGASFGAGRPAPVQPHGWPVDKVFL